MWKIPVAIGVAIVIALLIDWLIFKRNLPASAVKTYHPNLRIWGLGLITGIAVIVVSFFADVVRAHATCPPPGWTWVTVAPLFLLTAAVGFMVWAIVGLCKSE